MQLLTIVQYQFAPMLWHHHQRPLLIHHSWDNPYFGAFAELHPTFASITLWGGMARAAGMNDRVFISIICHELGHLLGGPPYQTIPLADWPSSEGQSDFWAASICLPQLKNYVSQDLSSSEFSRISGLEFIQFFQRWSYQTFEPVSLEKQDPMKVNETLFNAYPPINADWILLKRDLTAA